MRTSSSSLVLATSVIGCMGRSFGTRDPGLGIRGVEPNLELPGSSTPVVLYYSAELD
jgi:hypothetical protein